MRFQVQHGCSVYRVQPLNMDPQSIDSQNLAGRDTQEIRAILAPLGEDSDFWPRGIFPRMSNGQLYSARVDLMEVVHDDQVRERI